jgi:hypothetical protein
LITASEGVRGPIIICNVNKHPIRLERTVHDYTVSREDCFLDSPYPCPPCIEAMVKHPFHS